MYPSNWEPRSRPGEGPLGGPPAWSADWLHREATAFLALMTADGRFANEPPEQRDVLLRAALAAEMRKNTYDPGSGAIAIGDNRARAIEQVEEHFTALYQGGGEDALKLRREYAFPVAAF